MDIASDVYIGKYVTIEVEGVIESGTLIGNNVGIVGRRDHDVSHFETRAFDAATVRERRELSLPTRICEGAWLGYGAVVLSGVTVGRNAVVAAGAVVVADVPDFAIVSGNPARVVKMRR
ncbi:acyltransferase [Cupriavidus sp. 30B13]|uniref:acyltransferase n=1 Tax=Cupriavidus sp. 30B13 TaxID=3384241 RepID=UPI003B911227